MRPLHHRPRFQTRIRTRFRTRIAGLCLLVAWMVPATALLLSAATDTCACGMKKGSCFCELAARKGAHCDKDGGCSMKSAPRPDPVPLLASLDLRGWLPEAVRFDGFGKEPVGRVTGTVLPLPPAPAHFPETPPPRPLPIV